MSSVSRLRETGPLRKLRHEINMLRDEVKSLRIRPGAGYFIRPSTTGQVLEIRPGKGTTTESTTTDLEIRRLVVHQVYDEVLDCRETDENDSWDVGTDPIYVLRPKETRWNDSHSSIRGEGGGFNTVNTNTRTYNLQIILSGEYKNVFITEEMHPSWQIEGRIYAVKGLTDFNYRWTTANDGIPRDIEWIDMNIAGRHWRLQTETIEVCEGGVTKFALIPKSGTFL